MNYNVLENKVTGIRAGIKTVYAQINGIDNPLMPPKDFQFTAMRGRLDNEMYDVVVCGEVKKGKSSFINAIIGEDLLPVNTDVATCQVFRIVNSNEKRYELVFINGERKTITREDLPKYGSQVAANAEGMPVFDVAIDYIEIHYPIAFLPKNIAIVDTPGIGAVYADHEQITRRYLARAAAVIFIMDPQNPLTVPEKTFVESALSITDRIVFVMTKLDNYNSDTIVNMVRRNEEILHPFENSIWNKSVQVLPMSSKILKAAAANENAELRNLDMLASQFDKVQEALLRMVYTMIGLGDNIGFLNTLIAYDRSVQATIKDAESALSDNGNTTQLLHQRQQLQTDFAAKWGPDSLRYKDVAQTITDEANSITNKVAIVCGQTSRVAERFKSEIDDLSYDEVESYGSGLSTRIQDAVQQAVRNEVEAVTANINDKLEEYSRDISNYVSSNNDVAVGGISMDAIDTEGTGWNKAVNRFRMGYFNIILFTTIGSFLGPIGAAAGFLVGVIADIFMSRERKLREAKSKLNDYVNRAMIAANNSLCVEANPVTQVESIKRDIKKQAGDALRQVYNDQKEKVDARVRELTEQINADAATRQQKRQQLNSFMTAWQSVNSSIASLKQNIESLKKELQSV